MRMPPKWNKMNISEQESWLVKKLQEQYSIENEITKMLARIRGGRFCRRWGRRWSSLPVLLLT